VKEFTCRGVSCQKRSYLIIESEYVVETIDRGDSILINRSYN
jgi:hypothetical protein